MDRMAAVHSTRYADLIAAARRIAPSVLLPVLTNASIQQLTGGVYRPRPDELIHAWIIAAAARASIANDHEHRRRIVISKGTGRCRNTYVPIPRRTSPRH